MTPEEFAERQAGRTATFDERQGRIQDRVYNPTTDRLLHDGVIAGMPGFQGGGFVSPLANSAPAAARGALGSGVGSPIGSGSAGGMGASVGAVPQYARPDHAAILSNVPAPGGAASGAGMSGGIGGALGAMGGGQAPRLPAASAAAQQLPPQQPTPGGFYYQGAPQIFRPIPNTPVYAGPNAPAFNTHDRLINQNRLMAGVYDDPNRRRMAQAGQRGFDPLSQFSQDFQQSPEANALRRAQIADSMRSSSASRDTREARRARRQAVAQAERQFRRRGRLERQSAKQAQRQAGTADRQARRQARRDRRQARRARR